MEQDYQKIIADMRARGKSDEFIANVLTYNPNYALQPSAARSLVGLESKKKETAATGEFMRSTSSGGASALSSEESEKSEVKENTILNPTLKSNSLKPEIQQWRSYSLNTGAHEDVNMFDESEMEAAYTKDAVDWAIGKGKLGNGVTREDVFGDGLNEGNKEKIGLARSEYAKFYDSKFKEEQNKKYFDVDEDKEMAAQKRARVQSISSHYSEQIKKDYASSHEQMMKNNSEYKQQILDMQEKLKSGEYTKAMFEQEFNRLFMLSSSDFMRDKMNDYKEEILEGLSDEEREDADYLEELSEEVYDLTKGGLRINLDGDNVYNEDVGIISSFINSAGSAAAQMLSGPVSALAGLFGGEDTVAFTRFVDQTIEDMTANMETRDYRDHDYFSKGEGIDADGVLGTLNHLAHDLGRASQEGGAVLPYLAVGAVSGGYAPVVFGALGTINTYVDSEREDFNRVQKGLTPIFDPSSLGSNAQRMAMSLGIGAIQAGSGALMAGVGQRVIGKAGTSLTDAAVRKIFSGDLSKVTTKKAMSAYLVGQGIDALGEGTQEFVESFAQHVMETKMGNSTQSLNEGLAEAYDAFVAGAVGTGFLGAAGSPIGGAKSGRAILGVPSDVVTGPQAAVNSVADPSSSEVEVEGSEPVISGKSRESYGKTSGEISKHRSKNQALYQVIRLRHESAFGKLAKMDASLASMSKKAEAIYSKYSEGEAVTEEDQAALDKMSQEFKQVVEQRSTLFNSFKDESLTLTEEETQTVNRANISKRMGEMNNEVKARRQALDDHEAASNTKSSDPDALRLSKSKYEESKQTRDESMRLVGEVQGLINEAQKAREKASSSDTQKNKNRLKVAEEKVKKAERELLDYMGIKGFEAEVEAEVKVEPSKPISRLKQTESHKNNGGSTYSLDGKDLDGQPKFSVSIFPERSKLIEGDSVTEEDLDSFVEENKDLFEGNEDVLAVGTWFDSESGKTYLDVITAVDRDSAISLGRQYNQKAVWDLAAREEVDTGGDGEATTESKPEADRVKDIRLILGEEAEVEQEVEETPEETPEEGSKSDERGINGQFSDYSANKDGTTSVLPRGPLTKRMARFINGKLSRTIMNLGAQGRPVTIRVHNTEESGNRADGVGKNEINGYYVSYNNGGIMIHVNPALITRKAANSDKSFEAVMLEEVQHAMIGPHLNLLFKKDKASALRLLTDLKALAKLHPNKNIQEKVAAKEEAYRRLYDSTDKKGNRRFTQEEADAIVFEELVFEITSELADVWEGVDQKAKDTFFDKLRVLMNNMFKTIGAPKDYVITDVSSAEQLLSAMSQVHKSGVGVSVGPIEGKSSERASYSSSRPMSVSKLPENGKFEVMYSAPTYGRKETVGLQVGTVIKTQEFNGKWHFINWWKRATRMGKLPFGSFSVTIDGKDYALNVDAMLKWNMKPPATRRTPTQIAEERNRNRNKEATLINTLLYENMSIEERSNDGKQKLLDKIAIELFGAEFIASKEGKESIYSPPVGGETSFEVSKYTDPEVLSKLRMAIEEHFGLRKKEDGDDIATERASMEPMDIARDQGINQQEKRDKILEASKRKICGGVVFDCDITKGGGNLNTVFNALAPMVSDGERTPLSIASDIVPLIVYHNGTRVKRNGKDIREIGEEVKASFSKVSDFIESSLPSEMIPENHRDHFGVFASILATTSNGAKAEANLRVAIVVYRSYLMGIAGGKKPSQAVSEAVYKALRENNTEFIVKKDDVNQQRVGAVVTSIQNILSDADRYWDGTKFNSEAMAKRYSRKKSGKDAVQARFIMGSSDAEKTGEHAAGLMGKGERAYLHKENWVRKFFHVFQGNFTPLTGETFVNPEAVKGAESLVEELGITEEAINNYLKDEVGLSESDYGFRNRAARAIAAMKVGRKIFDGAAEKRKLSKALWRLMGRESIYGNLEVNDALSKESIREAVKLLNEGRSRGEKKWTAYHVQQSIWEVMQEEMGYMSEGELGYESYGDLTDKALADVELFDLKNLDLESEGKNSIKAINNSSGISSERAAMLFDPIDPGESDQVVESSESPLFKDREVKEVASIKGGAVMTDRMVDEALSTDKTSIRIIEEKNKVNVGQKVAVRLNLNVKKNTGVPVQTVHDKSATGKALKYSGAVTLSNVELAVNQGAREKIVTFQENKFPMAAVQGEFKSEGIDDSDYSGVKAMFNPFREHLFVDAAGRAIKSAEEATVVGNNVYLRGKIEYYSLNDPILQRGKIESPKGKAKRVMRGAKYDKSVNRFKAYAEKVLQMEFPNREALESAYDAMPLGSKVALEESTVAENMQTAQERASISNYTKGKKIRKTAEKQSRKFYGSTRSDIVQNPENYITPQNLKQLKAEVSDMGDQELINLMTDESIGKLSQKNDDLGVLAGAEMIRRAIARGETERIPSLVAELAAIGTTAGRILRHFRELKSGTPAGLYSIVNSAVENQGNKLSDEQGSRLKALTEKLFVEQAKADDLLKRAVGGEEVDAELQAAIDALKQTERELEGFTNSMVGKGWGTLFGQLVQGNLLTTMSQVVNIGANMVNAVASVAVNSVSLPFEAALVKVGQAMGKEVEISRRPSLNAYMYAVRKFGMGFIEAADQVVTGQDRELSEWRIARGLAPLRSLKAAYKGDLPLGPDGKGSLEQRIKLFVQGTLGIPAETMFRLLSLGDIPFRRFAEGVDLYQSALSMGLEGEALKRFLKYPTSRELESAKRQGRKLTFQEETSASENVNRVVSALEGMVGRPLNAMGLNGDEFSRALFRVILPFRSTPANILYETFTWVNPYIGTARMASELRKGDVEESSKTLAKMMMGAVTMEAALMMISEGIMSGPVKWDEDEEKNMAYDIFPPSSVNVSALRRLIAGEDASHQEDDYFVRYDKLGMFGAIMSTAVQAMDAEELKERDYSSPIQFASHTISDFFGAGSVSAISAMMEQSFVQGLNEFMKVLTGDNAERDLENLITTMFKAGSAAVLPNQLNAFYRADRDYLPDGRVSKDQEFWERLSSKFAYTIKDRTFGLSDYPVRVNWKGEDISQTPRGASGIGYQLFDITKSRQGTADPLSNEIWRLYENTEEFTGVCGTPSYASTRKFNVPNITSKKDKNMVRAIGRNYTWIKDEEFMAERVYLTTAQINRLMKISGKARHKEATEIIQTRKYKNSSDEERVEMLNKVAEKYNSAKEYGPNGYRQHTIALFDMMQELYDAR